MNICILLIRRYVNANNLMGAKGCLFHIFFSGETSLNFLFLTDILWSLKYWPAKSHKLGYIVEDTNLMMWPCYSKSQKHHLLTYFFSIIIAVFVNVKTYAKQFVLVEADTVLTVLEVCKAWRREKIHQLCVTTVSCEKVEALLNRLHRFRDLPSSHSSMYCSDRVKFLWH